MAGQAFVESPRLLGECREVVVAGCEARSGADGCDVVEVVPGSLELEQDRSRPGELRGRREPERLLAGVCVGDAVRDGAGRAGARDVRSALVECRAFGRALEAAVLVEEPRVELEDQIADDVEAEVAGLDHPGVDRPDRDLVRVVAVHGHGPGGEAGVVIDERTERLVAGERHAVEVEGLALVPARGRDVDERHRFPVGRRERLEPGRSGLVDEQRSHERAVPRGVEPGEPPAGGERLLDGAAVRGEPRCGARRSRDSLREARRRRRCRRAAARRS